MLGRLLATGVYPSGSGAVPVGPSGAVVAGFGRKGAAPTIGLLSRGSSAKRGAVPNGSTEPPALTSQYPALSGVGTRATKPVPAPSGALAAEPKKPASP